MDNLGMCISFVLLCLDNFAAMKNCFLLLTLGLVCLVAKAQPDVSHIELSDKVYVSGIKSATILPAGKVHGEPVARLGGGRGQLTLTFDDLESEDRYLKYTFVHCTHDWQLSDMSQIEYLNGFWEDEFTDYTYSFNTITRYIRHTLDFPTANMSFSRSGNYILFVYDETPDRPVLTRRFMVTESEPVAIAGSVHAASDVNYRFTRQEVDFTVYAGSLGIRNPAATVHTTIKQNGRWDNAIVGLTYRSGYAGELNFDYDDGRNTMDGGAEFRTFDISTLRSNADRIVGITFVNQENQAYVMQDEARPFGAYESRSTMDGDCYYRNRDMTNECSEDYVNTHFTLSSTFPFDNGDVYVFGKITDWSILPEAKLKYNENRRFWETAFLIKQGMYNYQYVYVPHGSRTVDATFIEGSHYETHNNYTIMVYYREEGSSYDKLIGLKTLQMGE